MPSATSDRDHSRPGNLPDIRMCIELRARTAGGVTRIPGLRDYRPKMHEVTTIAELCEYINENAELKDYYGYTVTENDVGKIEIADGGTSDIQWKRAWQPLRGWNADADIWDLMYRLHNFAPSRQEHAPIITWVILARLELLPGVEEPRGWEKFVSSRDGSGDA